MYARGAYIKRRIEALFPDAVVLESNSALSEIGWSNHIGSPFAGEGLSKSPMGGVGIRSTLIRRMEQTRIAMRHANLHPDLFNELEKSPSLFFAALAALSGWGLFQGSCFFPEETGDFAALSLLQNWICVPKQSLQTRKVH